MGNQSTEHGESQAVNTQPDGEVTSNADNSSRLPATLRLRSAGIGVIIAGIILVAVSPFLALVPGAAVLIVGALVAGALIWGDTPLVQLCVGVGSVGAIGVVEGIRPVIGFGALELGGVAILFGLADVVAGSVLHRMT